MRTSRLALVSLMISALGSACSGGRDGGGTPGTDGGVSSDGGTVVPTDGMVAPADGDVIAPTDGGAPPRVDAGPDMACDPLVPRAVAETAYALPDAFPDTFLAFLDGATESVDLAIYLLGDRGQVTDALKRLAGRVRVRILYEEGKTWESTVRALEAAGAETQSEPPIFHDSTYGPFYHAKFAIVDGRRAWISTGNLLESVMDDERNFDVYDEDPHDVDDLQEIFDADWARRAADLDCTRLVVSPENSRARTLAFIDGAERSLYIESMQFKDPEMREHIAARKAAGVDVRVILADGCWISDNIEAASFLSGAGVAARWMGEYSAHVKMMIADGNRVLSGSVNLSTNSLNRNREVSVVVTDPAAVAVYTTTFDHDFGRAYHDWTVFPSICMR